MTRHPPFLTGAMWPVHPAPQPDELLSSYAIRIARAHRARPRPFWKAAAGVSRLLEVDFEPPPSLIAVLVDHVGIDPGRIRQMTIDGFVKFGLLRDEDSRTIAFCPQCLKSDIPYYRRSWCLEFYTVCAKHGTALRTICGQCRAWIRFERLSLDNAFTACHKCGFDLRGAPTEAFHMGNRLQSVIAHQDRFTRLLQN